jgi:hypothetical protein
MGKTNRIRVLMGGLVAGVVVNVLWFGAWALFVRRSWSVALAAAGRPLWETGGTTVLVTMLGFLAGFVLVWLYAAIRPRYGAGPRTAVIASIAAWLLLGLIPDVALGSMLRLIPVRLWAIDVVETLVVTVVAAVLGAWVYKEQAP